MWRHRDRVGVQIFIWGNIIVEVEAGKSKICRTDQQARDSGGAV